MAYVIPTIFSAVDKYTQPLGRMEGATRNFSDKLQILGAKSERAFNRLPSVFSNATKTLIAYGEAAIGIEAALYTGKSLLDYQTEIQDLSAVTGASGDRLELFKEQIKSVADVTKRSMVDVAKAFTAVDNNMPELHNDAAGLAEVTKQSIILAQAARMELGPAAESLTMTMNQFGLSANKAQGVIDALSGGAVAGSSRISETTEALQKFGAASQNVIDISYNEAIALVELGSKFEKGSEAGTRMRNVLLDMENIKFGPAKDLMQGLGVNMEIVTNRALPLIDRLTELSKIKDSPQAMEKLFDKRNIVMASGLFSRLEDYKRILDATYRSGGTQDMANKNNNTFLVSLQRLRDKFINVAISSDKVNGTMSFLNNTIKFLTRHLDGFLNVAGAIVGVYATWWTITKVIKAITGIYWLWNAAIGVNAALQGTSLATMQLMTYELGLSEAAITGYTVATNAASFATGVLNSRMVAVVGTVGAAIALLAIWAGKWNAFNDTYAGLQMNYGRMDFKNVFESLKRNYEADPNKTLQFIKDNPKFDSPTLQKSFADIDRDKGIEKISQSQVDDNNSEMVYQKYLDQHNGQAPTSSDPTVNIYLHVDREGNVSADTKNVNGAIPVNVKQTGRFGKK